MKKLGNFIVKNKVIIIIVCLLLLIPSLIGIKNTRINYDILVYLPSDIETIKGENILTDDFKLGSYAISIFDNVSAKDAIEYENKIKKIEGVNQVVSLYDIVGTEIPIEMLPDEITSRLEKGNSTLLFITFENNISDETTLQAVDDIRNLVNDDALIGGMSSMVLDTKNLADKEVASYVIIAVICCIIVLMVTLDSYVVPVILLINIGIAILYNMGSNIILGNISYITKAISAILQLGVTTDFSIFLYHQYEQAKLTCKNNDEAMSKSISETINSIVGSSTTTIAGFLALCTMQLTLGTDIGIVMAKGVVFGVLSVITLFPCLILVFDKLIKKTSHKPFVPEFKHIKKFIVNKYKLIFIIFLILIIPAWWGQKNTEVYYNLDKTLPDTLASSIANTKLEEEYNIVSPMIILVPKTLNNNQINAMTEEIESLNNIDFVISYSKLSDLNIADEMIDDDIKKIFESDKYYLVLINSNYQKATTELNSQIDQIKEITQKYDKNVIIAGEGALVKDLVEISDTDFNNVSYTSIAIILIIIIFVLKSFSLPVLLVATIEFAIFVNMSVPYYTGEVIPFVSSIVIGTIQLGATIDYAILMTNKYLGKRKQGIDKFESIKYALDNSVSSIFISGMCFFAATFGVGLYSKLEMVGSLCSLIARGAIISMVVVIFVLPTLLIIFDKLIIKSTRGFKKGDKKIMKKSLKIAAICICALLPLNLNALEKEETVYVKADNQGNITKTIVTEHLINNDNSESIDDISYLSDIINTNGNETFKNDNSNITWNNTTSDIYYKGFTNKELPISININYYLDDVKYDAVKEINGKSGHVKIIVNYVNNDKHGSLYTPFTIMTAANINNENNKNIKITNGSVIDNGKNTMVVGISMPGLSSSLNTDSLSSLDEIVIEYDTTSFSTNSMYSVVTPKFIDVNEISNKLNSLYSKMNAMSDASEALVNGTKELADGINTINSNYAEFNTNFNYLNSGLDELSEKYEVLNENIGAINSNLALLNSSLSSIDELSTNLNALAENTQLLANSTSGLSSSLTLFLQASDAKTSAMTRIIQSLTPEEQEALSSDIVIVSTPVDLSSLTTLESNISALNDKVQLLNTNVKLLAEGSKTLSSSVTALSDGANQINNGSNTVNDTLKYIVTNSGKLNSASNSIYEGTQKLTSGANDLESGMNEFNTEAINELNNLINNELKSKVNILKKLNDLSNDYNSFGGSNATGSTKFVIQISK